MVILKKLYNGITFLQAEQEFWTFYIILQKQKEFYYLAAGKSLANPDSYHHALFNLKGEVYDFDRKMNTSLVLIIQQVIKEKHEQFTKEIQLAQAKQNIEKHIKELSNELGELMKKHNYTESWTKAGELNGLLKKEEVQKINPILVEKLQAELRGYYYINSEIQKFNKQLYAKGSKLIELSQL